jgi:RNA polymerase sigma-70 factor (ECF subfamily)
MQRNGDGDGDDELSSRLRARDPAVMGELYASHGRRLASIARGVVGPGGSADDVVQETFVRLWEHPDRYDPGRGTLTAYLTASSRSRALDLLRQEANRRAREDRVNAGATGSYVHVEEDGLRRALRQRLEQAMVDLPARQREAIALAYFAHLTYEEVALVLGQPVGTVKSRIRSGLRSLYGAIASEADAG